MITESEIIISVVAITSWEIGKWIYKKLFLTKQHMQMIKGSAKIEFESDSYIAGKLIDDGWAFA